MRWEQIRPFAALGVALSLILLPGCAWAQTIFPYAHKIENAVIMGVLGVDLAPETQNGVAVTASSGSRTGIGDSPGQEPVVLSARAETVAAACAKMQTFGPDYVFYGDAEQVLVGEDFAVRGIKTLLTNMVWDPELRLECHVWIVRDGKAADILFDATADGGAQEILSAMEVNADLLAFPSPRTGRAALADLLENGCTFLPALERKSTRTGDGAKGEHRMTTAGYAVLRDGAVVDWVEQEEALGVDLLMEESHGRMLEYTTPQFERVALKLTGVKTKLEPVFRAGELEGLSIICDLEAEVAELRGGERLSEESRTWLAEALKEEAESQLRNALDLSQALDADFLHLGGKAALAAPRHKVAMEKWEEVFPALAISLSVTGTVARM